MSSSLASHLKTLPEYRNSSRLQSLYSDIHRQKQSNPTGYAANVAWWKRLLERVVLDGFQEPSHDHFVLHVNSSLLESLRWEKAGKPLALPSVISDLTSQHTIIPVETFKNSPYSLYATSSLPVRIAGYVLGKPLWWALESLNIVGGESSTSYEQRWRDAQGDYVVISALENACEAVIRHQRSKSGQSASDSLHNRETFRVEFSPVILGKTGGELTDLDIHVLLRYLSRDKPILLSDKSVIKMLSSEDESDAITEVDKGVLDMKLSSRKLQEQVDEIQRKIDERLSLIKEHLRNKRQELAKSYLRSKKQLEELLVKRLNSLETIQTMLLKIDAAAGDIEIMRAYESSSATLRTLLSHPSLQRDHIDETMSNMSDVLADHTEIEQAIALGGEDARLARMDGVEIDEDELQDELMELVKQEDESRKAKEAEKRLEEKREKEREEKRRAAAALVAASAPKPIPSSETDTAQGEDVVEAREREERERVEAE